MYAEAVRHTLTSPPLPSHQLPQVSDGPIQTKTRLMAARSTDPPVSPHLLRPPDPALSRARRFLWFLCSECSCVVEPTESQPDFPSVYRADPTPPQSGFSARDRALGTFYPFFSLAPRPGTSTRSAVRLQSPLPTTRFFDITLLATQLRSKRVIIRPFLHSRSPAFRRIHALGQDFYFGQSLKRPHFLAPRAGLLPQTPHPSPSPKTE